MYDCVMLWRCPYIVIGRFLGTDVASYIFQSKEPTALWPNSFPRGSQRLHWPLERTMWKPMVALRAVSTHCVSDRVRFLWPCFIWFSSKLKESEPSPSFYPCSYLNLNQCFVVRSVSGEFRKVPFYKCSLEARYQLYLAKKEKIVK